MTGIINVPTDDMMPPSSSSPIRFILYTWGNSAIFLWTLLYFIPITLVNGILLPPFIGIQFLQYILAPYFHLWEIMAWKFGCTSSFFAGGSSDYDIRYFYLISVTLLTIILSFCWSLIINYRFSLRLSRINHVMRFIWENGIRIYLAGIMIYYGMIKAIPSQMPLPYPTELIQHIGDQFGMAYLWNMIGFSPVLEILTGIGEIIGGILLLIPRLIPLGGYINLIMMGLVTTFVFCYDVPAKIFVIYVFMAEFILLLPSLREFYQYFIHNRGIKPQSRTRILNTRKTWLRRLIIGIYIYILANFTLGSAIAIWIDYQNMQLNPQIPLNGTWNVLSDKSTDSQLTARLHTDKWITLTFTALQSSPESNFYAELSPLVHSPFPIIANYTAQQIQLNTKEQQLLPYELNLQYRIQGKILTLTVYDSHTHQLNLSITAQRAHWPHHPGEFHWIQGLLS